MSDDDLLSLWKHVAGDTSPDPWDDESVYGFFQRFRTTGAGVEAAIEVLPDGQELLRRLRAVYATTSKNNVHEDSEAGYFSAEKPMSSTTADLVGYARRQADCWAQMARELGDDELADSLKITNVEVTTTPLPTYPYDVYCDTPSAAVCDAESDWHGRLVSSCPHDDVLREAFYSIACDYTLARYLTWPWYANATKLVEPFEAYFELWRRGASIDLPEPGRIVLHLVDQDHPAG